MILNFLDGWQAYLVLLDQYSWTVNGKTETYRRMWDILVFLAASFSTYFWKLVNSRVDVSYETPAGLFLPFDLNDPNP